MKGIRGVYKYDYSYVFPTISCDYNPEKACYLAVGSWIIIGRRFGLPNEIVEMIKCKIREYDIKVWIGTYERILEYERKKVIEAKRVLKSFQKKKNFIKKR